jgi:carboxyl-terminal processing protease
VATHTSMASPVERPRGISRNIYFLTIAVVAVVGFVAGTRQDEIYATVGSALGVTVSTDTIDTASLKSTFRRLQENYDGTLDIPKLIEGANRGLVAAVGDDYTTFMSAEEVEQFNNDLSGNIGGGIGAEVGVRNDQPTILRTLADTPAEKAGLKAGDVVAMVNADDASGWSANEAVTAIRGEIGTTVKLTVIRDSERLEFTITRAEITSPSVESEVKDTIGVITIRRFDGETASLAKRAAEDLKGRGVKGVVLDLRGNGGGYLSSTQDVAGLWLDNKIIVSERRGDKVQEELRSESNPVLAGLPTVVLVDESSASASEIVAGALQDYDAAELIGKKTFGKGTVQKLVPLGNDTQLKVTIARWYTPNGRNITSDGIVPDREVELTEEAINTGSDPQMDAALKTLKS